MIGALLSTLTPIMRAMIRTTDLHIAININGTHVGSGLGKAHTMAVATITDNTIVSWDEYEVGWDALHGQGPEGTHHARIVRFMREHNIDVVITGHMGAPMLNTITKLGVKPVIDIIGDARQAALNVAATL